MTTTTEPATPSNRWQYVEIARYVPKLNAVIRYQKKVGDGRVPIFLSLGDEVEAYRQRWGNIGIYTSVFKYDKPDINASCIAPLYFDLDSERNVEIAWADTRRLVEYLADVVGDVFTVYFTGSKGFHIEIDHVTLGIDWSLPLPGLFRFVAEQIQQELDITTFDLKVYDSRRMWRLPNSRHQKIDKYKVELPRDVLNAGVDTIHNYASTPQALRTDDRRFNLMANQWFKDRLADYEIYVQQQGERSLQARLELFVKYGSALARPPSDKAIERAKAKSVEKMLNAERGERNTTLYQQAFRLISLSLESQVAVDEIVEPLREAAIAQDLTEREIDATIKSAFKKASQIKDEL